MTAGKELIRSAGEVLAGGAPEGLQILEISREPAGPAYSDGHIPGARWAYWRDLLWAERTRTIRSPESLRRSLAAAGFDPARTLLIYGEPTQFGAYAVWVLAVIAGMTDVAYLDGGRQAWQQAGGKLVPGGAAPVRPVQTPDEGTGSPVPAARPYVAGRADVLAAISAGVPVIDLRSTVEYRGEAGTPVPGKPTEVTRLGRLPHARSLPHTKLMDEHSRLLPAGELQAVFASAGLERPERCIVYCRSGHRSTLGWLALHVRLGWPDVAVYDGAWLEWANLVGAPIEVG